MADKYDDDFLLNYQYMTVTERRQKRNSKKQISYIEISDDEQKALKKPETPKKRKAAKEDDYEVNIDEDGDDFRQSNSEDFNISDDDFEDPKGKKKKTSPPKKKVEKKPKQETKKRKKDSPIESEDDPFTISKPSKQMTEEKELTKPKQVFEPNASPKKPVDPPNGSKVQPTKDEQPKSVSELIFLKVTTQATPEQPKQPPSSKVCIQSVKLNSLKSSQEQEKKRENAVENSPKGKKMEVNLLQDDSPKSNKPEPKCT